MEILMVFAYLLGIILVLLAGILIEKDDYFGFYPLFGGGLLLLISILSSEIGKTSGYKEGYKQGNIDGYNCIYKYHLETQSDSSIIWLENTK